MDKGSVVDRVKNYISSSENIKARGIAELSQRAVAVVDSWDETDVYFDSKSYKITNPRIWDNDEGKNCLFPPSLEKISLGVLPGVGRLPQVMGYDDALEFAKTQLEPIIKEAQWHIKPVELK